MAWPAFVQTGAGTSGPGYIFETGAPGKTRLRAVASRSLVWAATGATFDRDQAEVTSELGVQAVLTLPVTDQSGWREGDELIDVSEPDTHSHTYTITRELLDEKNRVVKGSFRQWDGVVIPTGSGPIDLDLLLPTTTVEGAKVSIPDSWSETLAEASQVVADAAGFASAAQTAAGAAATSAAEALEAVAPVADLAQGAKETADAAVPNTPEGRAALASSAEVSATIAEALGAAGVENLSALLEARFAELPAEDATTLTVITEAAYTTTPALGVPSGTLVKPARVGGGTTGDADVDFDTHFRYSGGPSMRGVDADWITAANDIVGVSMICAPEFVTSRGVSKLMLKVKASGNELAYRVSVGELWERAELHRATVVNNGVYYIVVDLASARSRRIKLEMLTGQFGGVIIPAGESIKRAPERELMVSLADSFGGGAFTPPNGATRLETFPNFIAQALGYDLTNMSIGGTNWGITSTPFEQRVLPSLAMSPALLMIVGSRNGPIDGTAPDTIYAAARTALALVSDVPVVVVAGPAQASFAANETATRNAADENGIRFVSILDVITGSLTGTDNVHPTFAGHWAIAVALLARMGFAKVQSRIAAISRITPSISLAASPSGSAAVGANVTLTATVQSGVAGVVEFRAGASVLGRASVVGGTAALTVNTLTLGVQQLSAKLIPADRAAYKPALSETLGYTVVSVALTDIITDNLLFELDVAQLSALADGAAIASMTPTRGSKLDALTQATSGSRMAYVANDGDGKPAIRQVNTQSLPAPSWAAPLTAGGQVTVFGVFKIVDEPDAGNLYIMNRGSSNTGVRLTRTPTALAADVASSGVGVPNVPALLGRWVVYALRVEAAGQVTAFQNRTSGDIFNATHATMAYAGHGFGGGSGVSGAEVRHRAAYGYAGGMSDTDIQAMLVYLANHHGATLDA